MKMLPRIFLLWAHRLPPDRHAQSDSYSNTLIIHGLKTGVTLHQTVRLLRSALSTSKR